MHKYLILHLIALLMLSGCEPVVNTGAPVSLGAPGDPRFAYVPLTVQNNDVLQVINTHTGFVVDSITMPGKSSGVLINSAGDRVYVAHRELGQVSIVNAENNLVLGTADNVGTTPKGMALDEVNGVLWVAVDAGITSVSIPNFTDVVQYPLSGSYTYTGLDVARMSHNGGEYLLSLGYNGADAGLSLIDLSNHAEVSSFSLGLISLGGMTVDKVTGEIYIADSTSRTARQVYLTTGSPPLFVNSLDHSLNDITDTNLTVNGVALHSYDAVGSAPESLLYAAYGMSTFVSDVCSLQSGGIKVLDRTNGNELDDLVLVAGDFSNSTSQPMLVSVRDDGTLIVVHAVVCTTDNGVFLSQVYVSPPDDFNPNYQFQELSRTSLGVAIQLVGDIIGPECALCPYGDKLTPDKAVRPSAFSFWSLLLLLPLVWVRWQLLRARAA